MQARGEGQCEDGESYQSCEATAGNKDGQPCDGHLLSDFWLRKNEFLLFHSPSL